MRYFCRHILLFAALGVLLCSCGGKHVDGDIGDASEPLYLRISERPQGGWIAVSVSPFDGSSDTLVIDRPMTDIIVMSTSHYGFLDALGRTDIISGISGPDFLFSGESPSETSSGGSTALYGSRQALTVRTPRFARSLPSLGEIVKASLHLLSFDLGPSLLRDEGVHGPDLPDLPTAADQGEAVGVSPDGGGTGAERSEASGGAERSLSEVEGRSEAVETPELAPPLPSGDSERSNAGSLRGTPLSPPGGRRGVDRRQPTSTPVDVGYDGAPDYEKIVALGPEVVLTYAVSGAKSQFVSRLEQLGIKVFTVNEHLERHPLARAAYIRLFGALCGQMDAADSLLAEVKDNYNAITDAVKKLGGQPRKVLLNIPYNDQWFVPASDNYLTAMIHDAGGTVLGTEEGKAASSVMSVEKAYSLSKGADCWLNIGWCRTIDDLLGVNPIFKEMLDNIKSNALRIGYGSYPVVWNDNKRINPKGGNDIWQSGVARPDLVLRDLSIILHPDNQGEASKTIYYRLIN